MLLVYQWIFIHLLADFVLQSKKMVRHKQRFKYRSWQLWLHCFIHAALIYLLSPDKTIWAIPLIIFVTHYLIDLWKLYRKDNLLYFVLDQAAHIAVLIAVWCIFYQPGGWWQHLRTAILQSRQGWLIASGYIIIIFPLSYILGYATQRWRQEAEDNFARTSISLSAAGKWIGIFERVLVFTFVLINHFEGIGFLIAAKSILRFNDIKGDHVRKEAEYVLIGTLMSFAASIITGLAVKLLL
ncbi:DUF3307 domain-containing protein [Deminuibacter soli]|uniref:DUF3307 domain-containing protein n=1 Tax=Deminuibacter soli TaxID=2291815 RepID=A0A3E1NME9_9BACT|nr:DUF3307 domain-containing protein [Deminuibacter soli]RFM29004.1 DUF3307 domain-containing protein [Deminuibacter soli]